MDALTLPFYRSWFAMRSILGRGDPRIASASHQLARRKRLVRSIPTDRPLLEIGPFFSPDFTGPQVRYFDVYPTEVLRKKAVEAGWSPDKVPHIHFHSSGGDLSIVADKFETIYSAHCIEHQPDLVRHLQQVSDLLTPGGCYYLCVPDKRYCFDHYKPVSHIGNILEAYAAARRVHTLETLVAHNVFDTHNDGPSHWRGDHAPREKRPPTHERVSSAVKAFEDSDGDYIDRHAWQFTPESFFDIVSLLFETGYTDLKPQIVCATPVRKLEFTAVLKKVARAARAPTVRT